MRGHGQSAQGALITPAALDSSGDRRSGAGRPRDMAAQTAPPDTRQAVRFQHAAGDAELHEHEQTHRRHFARWHKSRLPCQSPVRLRDPNQLEAQPIGGTEDMAAPFEPVFSPDGRWIVYVVRARFRRRRAALQRMPGVRGRGRASHHRPNYGPAVRGELAERHDCRGSRRRWNRSDARSRW